MTGVRREPRAGSYFTDYNGSVRKFRGQIVSCVNILTKARCENGNLYPPLPN